MRPLSTLGSNHHLVSLALAALALVGCSDDRTPTGIGDPAPMPPGPALATIGTTPTITHSVVNNGAGEQTDPHISGSRVSYSSLENNFDPFGVRYHDLATGADAIVPTGDQDDFASDISGSKIVFTRSTTQASSIYWFDVVTGVAPTEVAPSASVTIRNNAAIGGTTVVWQDFGFQGHPEIVVHDLTTGTTTRLTDDALLDRNPAVGPDGDVVIWVKCQTARQGFPVPTGCDVWKAVKSASVWTASAITGSAGEEAVPDVDGQFITYSSTRAGETDIYWQPVAGGTEQQLALTGIQTNPNISGGVVTFDSRADAAGNFDVWAYDIATDIAFPLTTTSAHETVSDVWVSPTGLVRVVYQSNATGDSNVLALSYQRSEGGVVCSTAPVRDQIKTLLTALQGLTLTSAQRTALLAPLKTAALAVFGGNKPAAIAALQNFMQLVSGPYRTVLGPAVAPLLNAAQCAIDRLSATPPA